MTIYSKMVQHNLRVAGPVDRFPCLAVMSKDLRWTYPRLYLLITPFSSLQIGRISIHSQWRLVDGEIPVMPFLLKGPRELVFFTRLNGNVDITLREALTSSQSELYTEAWEAFSKERRNSRHKAVAWNDNPAFYTTMHDCNFSANRRQLPVLKKGFPRLAFAEQRLDLLGVRVHRIVLCTDKQSEINLCINELPAPTTLAPLMGSVTRRIIGARLKGDSEAGVYAIDKPIKINIRT